MIEYPKIETVWDRDEKTKKVIPGQYRLPEFALIRSWFVTEKVDGTNIRIGLNPDGTVCIGGRTDAAQIPTPLLSYLLATFTPNKLREAFTRDGVLSDFTLFGEGYGPKIQNGGGYSAIPQFRLFDVRVGNWWLETDNILSVAQTLGIRVVPFLDSPLGLAETIPTTKESLQAMIDGSIVASEDGGTGCRAEGIVARAQPLLLTRRGDRLMWKLKFRDFA